MRRPPLAGRHHGLRRVVSEIGELVRREGISPFASSWRGGGGVWNVSFEKVIMETVFYSLNERLEKTAAL